MRLMKNTTKLIGINRN
ncbi:Protein of unknown function [Streptococcus thermophilus]|nr:Protein of unknown function [Streptococcus thermophilus]